jgi:hypothetical protein
MVIGRPSMFGALSTACSVALLATLTRYSEFWVGVLAVARIFFLDKYSRCFLSIP